MFKKVDRRNIQGFRMPQKYIMELFVIAVSVLTEKISAPVKVKLYRMRKTRKQARGYQNMTAA